MERKTLTSVSFVAYGYVDQNPLQVIPLISCDDQGTYSHITLSLGTTFPNNGQRYTVR